jgi:hypothetical protein
MTSPVSGRCSLPFASSSESEERTLKKEIRENLGIWLLGLDSH